MTIYIKYPLKPSALAKQKLPMFTICNKIEQKPTHLIVYPITGFDTKGNVSYPVQNNISFYCKSMAKNGFLKFKGNFWVEKCLVHERVTLARNWYFATSQSLPRKTKKRLIGTKKNSSK